MKLFVLAVGSKMPAWIEAGFKEYSQRMPRETAIHLVEIKPEKRSGKKIEQLLRTESERIHAALPSGCHVIAMDERGQQITTMRLADRLTEWMACGRDIAFVIGGADGLHPAIKSMAHEKLALSALTLPHGLVRVLLAEQLYRAVAIMRQHPYHRA